MDIWLNIAMISGFSVLGILIFIRYLKTRKLIIVPDKMWNNIRIAFAAIEVMALMSAFNTENGWLDYLRILVMILTCSVYMVTRDGACEGGVVSSGKFYPWSMVRAWDFHPRKNVIEYFYTLESTNPKKPDKYRTIEIDFDSKNKTLIETFMKNNAGRKYTRMKRK